jgi:GNAT superfamily N-acetyltransferase
MKTSIRRLKRKDGEMISRIFATIGWDRSVSEYQKYYKEQCDGSRVVLIAFINEDFAGYVTIVWQSEYPYFKENSIPEIQDLNVLPKFRRRRIASKLLDKAEKIVSERSSIVGIGVGLHPGYNAAQRLYVLRGYVPDSMGVVYKNKYIKQNQTITADDDLILHLVKKFNMQ